MIYSGGLRKLISMVVIITFVFCSDIFVNSQSGGDIVNQFQMAKEEYNKGHYVSAKNRIERIIGTIKGQDQDKKDILGACYLLLGAIYEKEGTSSLAKENYSNAKKYGVKFIGGVDLNSLPIYKRVVKDEIDIDTPFQKAVDEYNNGQYDNSKTSLEQVIDTIKGGALDKKGILGKSYLLLGAIYEKKGEKLLAEENYRRAKEEYGVESVEGAALGNLIVYRKIINSERIINGERKKPETKKKKFPVLLVIGGVVVIAAALLLLTKKPKPSPTPAFVTSTDILNVPEGGTADFNVRLSAQPSSTVSVSVTRVSGDTDVNVQSGSSLTFTTVDWNQNQTVTLAANDDVDTANDQAVIRISAAGIQNKDITAIESDKGCITSIAITSPSNNETVRETVTIQATVTSNCGVEVNRVEFFIDGELKATNTSAPYSYDWDTTKELVGPHVLLVRAFFSTGNNNDTQIIVTVTR